MPSSAKQNSFNWKHSMQIIWLQWVWAKGPGSSQSHADVQFLNQRNCLAKQVWQDIMPSENSSARQNTFQLKSFNANQKTNKIIIICDIFNNIIIHIYIYIWCLYWSRLSCTPRHCAASNPSQCMQPQLGPPIVFPLSSEEIPRGKRAPAEPSAKPIPSCTPHIVGMIILAKGVLQNSNFVRESVVDGRASGPLIFESDWVKTQ